MKRYLLAGLSILLTTTAFSSVVKAETMPMNTTGDANPTQLVTLAERGYLQDQKIPKGNQLSSAYETGEITARDVIQAAVNDRRVSAGTLEDQGYIAAVDAQLHSLFFQGGDDN